MPIENPPLVTNSGFADVVVIAAPDVALVSAIDPSGLGLSPSTPFAPQAVKNVRAAHAKRGEYEAQSKILQQKRELVASTTSKVFGRHAVHHEGDALTAM